MSTILREWKIDQAELQNQLVQIGIQTRFRLESLDLNIANIYFQGI